MIQFKRLLMINWMYYGIQVVDFDTSNLVTGVTGSGKSAMIDALQIVMLGEVGGAFFNKSATGNKSQRTIRTYLRGKYNTDEFKRGKKSFSSYIVTEFFDTIENESFCYGIMFDLGSDDDLRNDFFTIKKAFQTEWFLNNRIAKTRAELKEFFKKNEIDYSIFDSNKDYRGDLIYRLGVYDESFFRLFRNAVAYTPLDKIEDFIVHNICNIENTIDIEQMKTSIHEYHRMSKDLTNFIDRKNKLEEINKVYKEYRNKFSLLQEQQYFIDRSSVDCVRENILAKEVELKQNLETHTAKTQESEQLEDEQRVLSSKYTQLIQEIAQNPEKLRKEYLSEEYKKNDTLIKESKTNGEKRLLKLQQRASAWQKHLLCILDNQILDKASKEKVLNLQQYLAECNLYTVNNFEKFDCLRLSQQNTLLSSLKNDITSKRGISETELSQTTTEIIAYNQKISELETGKKQYDKGLLEFKLHLEKELSKCFGKDIKTEILADLLTITDLRWTNVIEGYMYRQKMYLMVDPIYYKQALHIYKQFCKENFGENFGLFDGAKVYEDKKTIHFKGLSHVIKSQNKYAMAYVEYLLGHVVRVDSIEDIRNYNTAVTDDGMLYKGYACTKMSSKQWQRHFIGEDSIKQQLSEAREQLAQLKNKQQQLKHELSLLEPMVNEEIFGADYIEVLSIAVDKLKDIPQLNKKCDELFNELNKIDDSYVNNLENDKSQIEKTNAQLSIKMKSLGNEIGGLEKEKNNLEEEIGRLGDQFTSESKKFDNIYCDMPYINDSLKLRYEEIIRQKGSAQKVKEAYEQALKTTETNLSNKKYEFQNKIQDYNKSHTEYSISNDILSNEWVLAYENANKIDIENYQNRITSAQRKSEELFRNEFINQIKRNIDTAKREIKGLNKSLSEYTFGKTKYRFKCEPTENAELRSYYEMIIDPRLDGYSLYNEEIYRQYEPLIKTLFSMIASTEDDISTREEIERNINKFKSFQTYLKFDLVEVDESGKEQPLSIMMGSKSGGERQTPFYIAILASLMKVYRMNENANSLRLVVFDEAFDKIDTSRIEEFVTMLKSTGFQCIIAAPNDKTAYIAPVVNRTWVVMKPNDTTSQICAYKQLEN